MHSTFKCLIILFRPLRCYPLAVSAHFNGRGTRLLCREYLGLESCHWEEHPTLFALYDLKSQETKPSMRLTASDSWFRSLNTYEYEFNLEEMTACFAGGDGEFVAGCFDGTGRVYIWSPLVVSYHQRCQVQPLVTLEYKECSIVRYNEARCILATSSFPNGSLKLWTPFRLPEPITSNSGDDGGSTSH